MVVEERTSALTTAELVARREAVDVPCAPIADYGQMFTDEHLAARDFFWDAPHPVAGAVRQIGSPMRFSRTPVERAGAGPVLGADTRAALRKAGYGDDEIDALVASGTAQEAR